MISHSHQKLHRSLLDADLQATRTMEPREPAPVAGEPRTTLPGPAERGDGRLRAAVAVLSILLAAVIGYGYLAMVQNNVSVRQLPGSQAVNGGMRGPVGAGIRRAGAALEAVGDRTAEFLARTADKIDNWRKSR